MPLLAGKDAACLTLRLISDNAAITLRNLELNWFKDGNQFRQGIFNEKPN